MKSRRHSLIVSILLVAVSFLTIWNTYLTLGISMIKPIILTIFSDHVYCFSDKVKEEMVALQRVNNDRQVKTALHELHKRLDCLI